MTAAPNQIPSLSGGNTSDMRRCYACNSEHAPKRVKIDGFTEALCVADYARFQRGESLLPFGCEPTGIEAHPLSAEQVERDLAALKAGSEAAMAKAARNSNPAEVAAFEEAEKQHSGRGRVKVARVPTAPKVAPAPVAAPIQVAAVVAVEPKPKPPNEARRAIYAARPQNQGARFALWPDADKHPNRCRREGCTKKPWSRGLCQACNQGARARKILDEVGLPPKPYASGAIRARTNTVQDQIEAIVRENPSIHLKDLVPMTKFAYRQCYRAVTTMRKNKRLVKPKCHHHDPEYMRLYLVNP